MGTPLPVCVLASVLDTMASWRVQGGFDMFNFGINGRWLG